MSRSDFDDFVKRQQTGVETFDPKKQLDEWIEHLNALYRQIESYLKTYLTSGEAQLEYRDVQLNEEFIGAYTAREMILKIGRATVIFKPIGTMVIGMKGRVDVEGPSGRAPLFLVNKQATTARSLIQVTVRLSGQPPPPPPTPESIKQIEWAWKIGTPPPEVRFVELTQDAFFEMILAVANA